MSDFRRDTLVSLSGQVVAVGSGAFRALVVPILFGAAVGEYAAWQSYLVYAGLVGFLLVGFNDGYLVRFREHEVSRDKSRRASAVSVDFVFVALETISLLVLIAIIFPGENALVWIGVVSNVPILACFGIAVYSLQMSDNIVLASKVMIAERVLFVAVISVLSQVASLSAMSLVIADLTVRGSSALLLMFFARSTLRSSRLDIRHGLTEFKLCVRVGFPLMLGSFVLIMTATVPRVVAEVTATRTEFASFALAAALTNVVLVLGQALGNVLFPHLSRASEGEIVRRFGQLDRWMRLVFALFLLSTFPLTVLLDILLPQYASATRYLPALMVCVSFQLIVGYVNGAFYRVLGLQRELLVDNALALALVCAGAALSRGDLSVILGVQAVALSALMARGQRRFAKKIGDRLPSSFISNWSWVGVFTMCVVLFQPPTGFVVMAMIIAGVSISSSLTRRSGVESDSAQ